MGIIAAIGAAISAGSSVAGTVSQANAAADQKKQAEQIASENAAEQKKLEQEQKTEDARLKAASERDQAAAQQRQRQAGAQGRSGTIKTAPIGAPLGNIGGGSNTAIAGKTLLGL